MHIMRTSLVIDEALMAQAMKAGPYKTKKAAVEAGLKLLARKVACREILTWRGKLNFEGDDDIDWTRPIIETSEPRRADDGKPSKPVVAVAAGKRRARR